MCLVKACNVLTVKKVQRHQSGPVKNLKFQALEVFTPSTRNGEAEPESVIIMHTKHSTPVLRM